MRATLGASLAVAIALTVGAVAVSAILENQLTNNVDSALQLRATDIEALLAGGSLPDELSVRESEEALVQVLGPDGTVVASSANVAGLAPFTGSFVPRGDREFRSFDGLPIDEDEDFRVIAQQVQVGAGVFTIYVAESLDERVNESVTALNRILLVAVPLLVLFVAGLTWIVVGRALSPVEAIRAEVAAISGADLQRRVPEPSAGDEIGRLAKTMNAMLARLETAQQRQQRFVADASHELRSPLTSIRSQIEVDLADPEVAAPLETERAVLEEATRMERLVDDLLQLARLDVVRPLRAEAVDLDDLVFREIERLRADQALSLDSSKVSGAQLPGDRDQLRRAIRNLLDNAARYANQRVVVTLREEAERVELTIADDGPGIPPDARERIFERFTRLDEARARVAGGFGLGLAITREIVERHAGEVFVDPQYAGGARFIVRLPKRNSEGG